MKTIRFTIVILLCTVVILSLDAQCPMCRMSLESNMQEGGGNSIGRNINAGILYMLLIPYLLVGTIAYIWYKNYRKQLELEK